MLLCIIAGTALAENLVFRNRLIDARKALKMFNMVNVPVLCIFENMSYFIAPYTGNRYDIFGSGGGESLSKELETFFLGGIPIDPRIREGGDNGSPVALDGSTVIGEAFDKLAQNVAQQVAIRNAKYEATKIVEIKHT